MLLVLMFLAYQGAVEVPRVKSGLTPAPGTRRLVLTEDLRFGGTGDGYRWMGSSNHLAVNDAGEIFLADSGTSRILHYDAQGKHLGTLVPQGKAPGQLSALAHMILLDSGELLVMESEPGVPARFHIFTTSGTLVRSLTMVNPMVIRTCALDPQAKNLAGTALTLRSDGTVDTRMGWWDMELRPREIMLERQDEFKPERFNDRAYLLGYLSGLIELAYAPKMLFAFDAKGQLWQARSDRYEITRRSERPGEARVVEKEYSPIANDPGHVAQIARPLVDLFKQSVGSKDLINREFLTEMISTAKLPSHKPPLFGLVDLGEFGLLAVHDVNLGTGSQLAHVFDTQGRYAGDLRMEHRALLDENEEAAMIVRKGYVYTVEKKDGVAQIVRYRPKLEAGP